MRPEETDRKDEDYCFRQCDIFGPSKKKRDKNDKKTGKDKNKGSDENERTVGNEEEKNGEEEEEDDQHNVVLSCPLSLFPEA